MAALLLVQLALSPVEGDLTKDDVLRLTREGKPAAEILHAIGSSRFTLTADEVVELQKAGVAEPVLARMLSGPSPLTVENKAHKAVRIRLREGTIEIGVGEELRPGTSITLPGSGELGVTVDGRPRSVRVKAPATLTFRGSDRETFEVLTLYVEGPGGEDSCVVESRPK